MYTNNSKEVNMNTDNDDINRDIMGGRMNKDTIVLIAGNEYMNTYIYLYIYIYVRVWMDGHIFMYRHLYKYLHHIRNCI
jgi:hypothetical protein